MAKKRSRGVWRRVPFTVEMALGALATRDVIDQAMLNAADEKYRLVSVEWSATIADMTAGEGPVGFGFADGDYVASEIEECIEAVGALSIGDRVSQEQANRRVRRLGQIFAAEPTFDEGKMHKTRLNWLVATGKQPKFYAYNESGAQLTTGGLLIMSGYVNAFFPN